MAPLEESLLGVLSVSDGGIFLRVDDDSGLEVVDRLELGEKIVMATASKSKRSAPKRRRSASAFVAANAQGDHIVGVNDLRVILTDNGSHWLAQGVEIDYAAVGKDIEDVKRRFEDGLRLTIRENIKVHGDIDRVLVGAPSSILFTGGILMVHSQTSFHDVGCLTAGISYLVRAVA